MSINPGDLVTVIKRVEEEYGWDNCWTDQMDEAIGREFAVININGLGVKLKSHEFWQRFPPSSLSKNGLSIFEDE